MVVSLYSDVADSASLIRTMSGCWSVGVESGLCLGLCLGVGVRVDDGEIVDD